MSKNGDLKKFLSRKRLAHFWYYYIFRPKIGFFNRKLHQK